MRAQQTHSLLAVLLAAGIGAVLLVGGCSGGGGASGVGSGPDGSSPSPPPLPPPPPPPPPPEPTGAFATAPGTSRFLTQATFGPTEEDVAALTGKSASDWFLAELAKPASLHLPQLEAYRAMITDPDEDFPVLAVQSSTLSFWRNAIGGDDQLRQRMAFALSQILVVSNLGGEVLTDIPEPVVGYQDGLIENAFGNYRDLLEAVTYSPATDSALHGRQVALPPNLPQLERVLRLGKAAIVGNVGPRVEPVTRASFERGEARLPPRLFSQNDQQSVWKAGQPEGARFGWGGHQIVLGGAVRGGELYGSLPPPAFGHDADSGGGRLIPSVAVDQYAAELGRWFGLTDTELAGALPGLGNFDPLHAAFI